MENEGNESVEGQEVKEGEQPTTAQPQSPTTEEQLKALQAQLTESDARNQRMEKSYKGLQTTVNKTNEELKRQSDLRGEIEGLKETQKILAAMLQERGSVSEENLDNIPQGKKQDYLKQFEEAQKRIDTKRQMEIAQAKLTETVKGLQERTEALGLKDNDESYVEIRELVETGLYKTAETKLKKLESKKETNVVEPKKEEPKETEEQIFERIARKKGLLKSETIVSAGGNANRTGILQDYIAGKINGETANEKLRAIGESPI